MRSGIYTKSIVYIPQSNGRAERAVQSIINALRLYVVFRELGWIYALPFALWGLNNLPGPIAPFSRHRLVFGRDPIMFDEAPPLTVKSGVEVATEYFCRAQDERQLAKQQLDHLHAQEYQAVLKKHPSLRFKEETPHGSKTGLISLAYIPSWTGYGRALQISSVRIPRIHAW